mmetsp:Transcript_44499/g.53840  ORF Transcript_44499/g.53840 Transcript_44499/m.53840 type:complete len:91 (-) Transcript_44499:926-1198(-)
MVGDTVGDGLLADWLSDLTSETSSIFFEEAEASDVACFKHTSFSQDKPGKHLLFWSTPSSLQPVSIMAHGQSMRHGSSCFSASVRTFDWH